MGATNTHTLSHTHTHSHTHTQANWDGCFKEYNKTLMSFNIEASKLDDLEQQLAQLVQNCSISTPPASGKYPEKSINIECLETGNVLGADFFQEKK
jgi:predicted DNA-binding ArsR family transcriptional regulator